MTLAVVATMRNAAIRGVVVASLVPGLLAAAGDRAHWHRLDRRPVDPSALASALAFCGTEAGSPPDRERKLARCMSAQGYYSWDGV